jgi:hypothetical protein
LHKVLRALISGAHVNPIPLERKISQLEFANLSRRFIVSKLGFLKGEFITQIKDKFLEYIEPPYCSPEAEALSFFESISLSMATTLIDECTLDSSAEWVLRKLVQDRMTEYTHPSLSFFGDSFYTNVKELIDESFDTDSNCTSDSITGHFEVSFDNVILKVEAQLNNNLEFDGGIL